MEMPAAFRAVSRSPQDTGNAEQGPWAPRGMPCAAHLPDLLLSPKGRPTQVGLHAHHWPVWRAPPPDAHQLFQTNTVSEFLLNVDPLVCRDNCSITAVLFGGGGCAPVCVCAVCAHLCVSGVCACMCDQRVGGVCARVHVTSVCECS